MLILGEADEMLNKGTTHVSYYMQSSDCQDRDWNVGSKDGEGFAAMVTWPQTKYFLNIALNLDGEVCNTTMATL